MALFAFGHGVDEDETYSYILSKKYWTNWHIVNKAVEAWGTSHAYMTLSDEIERDNPQSIVIYGMIPDHITRNYIRRNWVKALTYYDVAHPHFELVNGNLEFQGVIDVTKAIPGSRELRKKELELTGSFLVSMQDRCKKKQIPFVVVLFPPQKPGACWPPHIIKTLVENDIPFLDLSEVKLEAFPNDGHPNESDHKLIAQTISESFISEILESLLINAKVRNVQPEHE